jgi:ferric enterobactin receptor
MRLVKTRKYQSAIKNNKTILCFILISFLFHSSLIAQTYRLTFRNTPLSNALIRISGQLDIKVAFDSKKLGSVTINRDVTGNSAEEVISDLLWNSGFEYKIKYNKYLIIDKEKVEGENNSEEYQLIGSISDRESGEQLPYATVILYNKNLQISASEKGSFSIKNITSNPVHLFISYIGYNPLDTTILMTDRLANFNLKLGKRIHSLDTIVVKGTKLEMIDLRNDVDFATTINLVKLTDLPTLAETDIFRTLQLLPGISYTENSQGLSIRGGLSDQNLVLFDGQTLYNLSHYYGVVSALNPNIIKDMQIYKGGYDSRFGERVSGIVDITSKSGNQTKPTVYGDLNLISGNLTTEIPVGKKVSVIGAVRRSYSDIYSTGFSYGLFDRNMSWFRGDSVTIINQTRPNYYYYDYNAKVTFKPSNVESFSLSLYGGKDYFQNSYSGSSDMLMINVNDINSWSNYGFNASWFRQRNESLFSSIQAGSSRYENQASNSTTIDRTLSTEFDPNLLPDTVNTFNTCSQNNLKDIYFSVRNNYKISNNNQLDFGFLTRKNKIYYHKDADKVYIYDNLVQSGWTTSAYLQDRITISNKLTLKPGLRLSRYSNTWGWHAEPRFSANYKFSDTFSIRIATGRYYQFINQVLTQQETGYNKNFWIMADNKIHPAITSNHFIAGFTAERGRFLLDAEVYYKSYSGLQEYVYVSQFLKNSDFPKYFPGNENNVPTLAKPAPSFYVTGTGRSYGIDLLLRYKGNKFNSWLSYSLGRSIQNYSYINFGNDIPAPSDQPHQLSWTNILSAGKWNFGTITLFSTGRPYIDFTTSSINLPIVRNYKRLPDYFRSDFSVNYNFSICKAKLKTGLSFINIFNTQNYFNVSTRKFDFENTSFSEATLIQSQSFSINMFIHFVF